MEAFEAIASTTLGSNTATITFSSIPATYEHLQLRIYARTNASGTNNGNLCLRFNSDTGSNYAQHELRGNGTSVTAGGYTSQTHAFAGYITAASAGSNIFGVCLVDIVDYASTNKYTTVRSLNGNDTNGAGIVSFYSSLWLNTAAVSTIDVKMFSASDSMVTGTVVSLYGLRSS